ncbi:hypothetical protein JKF63_00818 [Porcisia hertigi]|uniref:Mitochondrial chaperone BCS1 n=1 Tax=Porcisia hertigi TaxID=2761500 RepID=A0A836HCB7_9TRYP|nr:hypothetical protein JKF63_00818 [Porcisia hertigi]
MQRHGMVAARCIRASVSQRGSFAGSGTCFVWYPLRVVKRDFHMPNPSDLLTSPAGLMALLHGRTGNQRGVPPTFTQSPPDNKEPQGRRERRKLRARRQQRGILSTEDSSNEEGEGRRAGTRSIALGNKEVIMLAFAIFILSAMWDLFTAQKSTMWQFLKNSLSTTLEVRSSSQEFAMIVDWMGRQPHGQCIRNLALKPVTIQDEQKMVWRDAPLSLSDDTDAGADTDADARVTLVPGYGSHLFRFGSTWVHITRSEDLSKQKAAAANRVDRENDKLTLTFFTRRRAVVQQFITHVHESWRANVRNTVYMYLSEGYGPRWRPLTERIRRPLSTLYLPSETKAVVDEARLFFQLKDTYAALGIPWRRGYLLEGPPGTGKTSFVMALAGELGLPVHILSLRSDNMDDDALLSLASSVPRRSILLIEDLENVLKTQPRAAHYAGGATVSVASTEEVVEVPPTSPASSYSTDIGGGPRSAMSLSALLNALDGVSSGEGRLLLITANNTSHIPFAEVLLRPGRIDRRIKFEPLHAEQVREMEASFRQGLQSHSASATGNLRLPSMCLGSHKNEDDAPAALTPAQCQQLLLDTVYASLMPKPVSKSK